MPITAPPRAGGESPPRLTVTFVNWDTPDGGTGSIRVDTGDTAAAVEIARASGTGVVIRVVDMDTALTVERVRVR